MKERIKQRTKESMKAGWKKAVLLTGAALTTTVYASELAGEASHDVLITGFAVSQPAQFTDVQDVAHGFPRELGKRLEQAQMMKVKLVPELLSVGWEPEAPGKKLLAEMGTLHHARYIVAGTVTNGGQFDIPVLFGLFAKHRRSFDVELMIYDAQTGQRVSHLSFSGLTSGDALIGREQAFGGAGFASTAYGKTIMEVADQAAQAVTASLAMQP